MKWMQRRLWYTDEIKRFLRIYPFSFAAVFLILLAVRNYKADYCIIEDERIPLGAVDFSEDFMEGASEEFLAGDERLLEKNLLVDQTLYKVIFEQETGLYLVYRGYSFVGCLQLQEGQSLHLVEASDVLDQIIPYEEVMPCIQEKPLFSQPCPNEKGL